MTVPVPVRQNTDRASGSGSGITWRRHRSVMAGGFCPRVFGRWHSAYFVPEPHGQGSFGSMSATAPSRFSDDHERQAGIEIPSKIGNRQLHARQHDQQVDEEATETP